MYERETFMRFKTMLFALIAVALVVSPIMAKDVEKTSYRKADFNTMTSRDLFESFEGDFPPAGWTVESPSGHTGEQSWFQGTTSPSDGISHAQCDYDPALVAQDCRLSFATEIIEGAEHLNFSMAASLYWMTDPNANYTMKVLVDDVEMFDLASVYVGPNWVHEVHDIDLTDYIGQTVTVTFQYVGNDGAAIYLDAVGVNEGVEGPPPPPPAPENDTCDGAIAVDPGTFSITGDLTNATNAFVTLGSDGCTGYNADGNDVVYVMTMAPEAVLDVSVTGSHDGAIYLVTDCMDPANTCLVGADDTLSGDAEVLTYTNDTGEALVVFFVVDAYSGGADFVMEGTLTGVVATNDATFGSVKAMYR